MYINLLDSTICFIPASSFFPALNISLEDMKSLEIKYQLIWMPKTWKHKTS